MKFGFRKPSLKRSISARTTGQAKRAIKRALIPASENAAWASCIPRKPSTTVYIAAQRSGWATSSKHCSNKRYYYGWFTLSRMWMPGGCSL